MTLGIDHPLVAVRDIGAMRERMVALGFTMTPVTRHPWGTSTSVAVFDRCLLELMGVYDEALLDEKPAGSFRFGRVVAGHLADREGISLVALHSGDAHGDADAVQARGVAGQGAIEFGRDVVTPEGRADRTATTLRILFDPALPRLSFFVCQQHRPDLIYVPRWMDHANGVTGICQVTVMADGADWPRVRRRFAGVYGADSISNIADGLSVRTGNGVFVVTDRGGVERRYGALPAALVGERGPCCVAMHFRAPLLDRVRSILGQAGAGFVEDGTRLVLTQMGAYANVAFVFEAGRYLDG